jgi:hypothetical protein
MVIVSKKGLMTIVCHFSVNSDAFELKVHVNRYVKQQFQGCAVAYVILRTEPCHNNYVRETYLRAASYIKHSFEKNHFKTFTEGHGTVVCQQKSQLVLLT